MHIPQAILAIAGSDPSGGAGIQADLKTFSLVGVYGCAAPTSLTVQNTLGVFEIFSVPADFVVKQVAAVLADLPVSHIKIGMIGSPRTAEAVGELLARFGGEIFCDPVLRASDATTLFDADALDVFQRSVIANATVLTPNIAELAALAGMPCGNVEESIAAAGALLERFPRLQAVTVKGGHLAASDSLVTDALVERDSGGRHEAFRISRPRIVTRNSHGTGCTFASAMAAFHLLDPDMRQAFAHAGRLVAELLAKSRDCAMGGGTGPLLHHLWRDDR